jgi:hypothetical protein
LKLDINVILKVSKKINYVKLFNYSVEKWKKQQPKRIKLINMLRFFELYEKKTKSNKLKMKSKELKSINKI